MNENVLYKPNCIDKELLKRLKKEGIKDIELEVQSSNNYILKHAGLEYTFNDIKKASKIIKRKGFNLAYQVMVGLPESTKIDDLNTAKDLAKLKPKKVRISPVVVIENTPLANEYKSGDYEPITLNQAIERCKNMVYEFNRKKIESITIGLPMQDKRLEKKDKKLGVIAGPYDENFGSLVEQSIWYDSIVDKIKQINAKVKQVKVTVNPNEVENVKGRENINLENLKHLYNVEVIVETNENIKLGKSQIDILSIYED